jgi:hypothetical protein
MKHRHAFIAIALLLVGSGCQGSDGALNTNNGADALAGGNDAGAMIRTPWQWENSYVTENKTSSFIGYDQGCAQLGDLKAVDGGISFTIGYSLQKPVADRMKHFAGAATQDDIDDGSLNGYAVVGTVLILYVVKQTIDPVQGDSVQTPLGPYQRFADPNLRSAAGGSFSGTINLAGGNPCEFGDAFCRPLVSPTFVVVWESTATNERAYQFIRPTLIAPQLLERPRFADCPTLPPATGTRSFHQTLGVYWPLHEKFARQLDGAPDPARWTEWIDEVLPL